MAQKLAADKNWLPLGVRSWALCVVVALFSFEGDNGQQHEERSEPVARLDREDGQGYSVCTMHIDDIRKWSVETPRVIDSAYNANGWLVGLGTTNIAFGSKRVESEAFFIVNSAGQMVRLDARMPTHGWPHGNKYPITRGVYALEDTAVMRIWEGPGFDEVWWTYGSEGGEPLRCISPEKEMRARLSPDASGPLCLNTVQPLGEAPMFLVLAAPWPAVRAELGGSDHRAGNTIIGLIRLDGVLLWWNQCPQGSYYGDPLVEKVGQRRYRLEVECAPNGEGGSHRVMVGQDADGTWKAEPTKWR